jgi:Ricin-type beta-trefoil lectin domain
LLKTKFTLQLQSASDPELCVDTLSAGHGKSIGLYPCHANRTHPHYCQMFVLTYFRDVANDNDDCLDVPNDAPKSGILLDSCHQGQGNQFWRYDPVRKK